MLRKAPSFWWRHASLACLVLKPIGAMYGFFAMRRLRRRSPQIDLPVLCVGNFTLGGAGKTPLVIALAQSATLAGLKPGIVSRGYGRVKRIIHLVDREKDTARDVGDEALLLARHALVAVGVDRYLAAQKLKEQGCDIILMDDGFQSRRLYPDYVLVVVDGMAGVGNGQIFPAGPLRAPLKGQMAYADSLLVIDPGKKQDKSEKTGKRAASTRLQSLVRMAARAAKPIDRAKLAPSSRNKIKGKNFLAFAGIGNPDKFFASLEGMGGKILHKRIFADHHFFKTYELERLEEMARSQKLWLATTAKDEIRFRDQQKPKRLVVVDVTVDFADPHFPARILRWTQERYKQRLS